MVLAEGGGCDEELICGVIAKNEKVPRFFKGVGLRQINTPYTFLRTVDLS